MIAAGPYRLFVRPYYATWCSTSCVCVRCIGLDLKLEPAYCAQFPRVTR